MTQMERRPIYVVQWYARYDLSAHDGRVDPRKPLKSGSLSWTRLPVWGTTCSAGYLKLTREADDLGINPTLCEGVFTRILSIAAGWEPELRGIVWLDHGLHPTPEELARLMLWRKGGGELMTKCLQALIAADWLSYEDRRSEAVKGNGIETTAQPITAPNNSLRDKSVGQSAQPTCVMPQTEAETCSNPQFSTGNKPLDQTPQSDTELPGTPPGCGNSGELRGTPGNSRKLRELPAKTKTNTKTNTSLLKNKANTPQGKSRVSMGRKRRNLAQEFFKEIFQKPYSPSHSPAANAALFVRRAWAMLATMQPNRNGLQERADQTCFENLSQRILDGCGGDSERLLRQLGEAHDLIASVLVGGTANNKMAVFQSEAEKLWPLRLKQPTLAKEG